MRRRLSVEAHMRLFQSVAVWFALSESVRLQHRCIKEPLDDAALGKHFSIMHHRYSQSSMLLKHTANSPILDWCCMLQQHATLHFKVSRLRVLVEGWYCYNDWLYQEKLSHFWLKNKFIIRNSFPYNIPICKILYELKLYYSQLMKSFNMYHFLYQIAIYVIVKITKFETIL